MKLVLAAALVSASIATIAFADPMKVSELPPEPSLAAVAESTAGATVVPDGRAMASDQEVGEARRAYRAQCSRFESPGFCDCVTAGVAQALAPADVRIAARTIGERISSQGDAPAGADSDTAASVEPTMTRIELVEAHYADACQQLRR